MKKLLLILTAVFVSVAGWAGNDEAAPYTLNPYAYGLSSSWNVETQTLTVNFKLNAEPNLDADKNSSHSDHPRGIQLYAVDSRGNSYRIWGPSEQNIKDKNLDYQHIEIPLANRVDLDGKAIPVGERLTWKVTVKGRDKNGRNDPTKIDVPSEFKHPWPAMGVDVNKDPNSPNYGKIYVTAASDGSTKQNSSTHKWLYDALYDANYVASSGDHKRMPAVLEYTPRLAYNTLHKKYTHIKENETRYNDWFSSTIYYEPHRLRISKDGRVFVTSYHPSASAAVMELREDLGKNIFKTVIGFDNSNTQVANDNLRNRRVVSMDVRGEDDDLTILLAWVKPEAWYSNNNPRAKIEVWEYEVGNQDKVLRFDEGKKVAEYWDHLAGVAVLGLIYQGYVFKTSNGIQYDMGRLGFIEVAYGEGNDIWMKVDFAMNPDNGFQSRIMYFNRTGDLTAKSTYVTPRGGVYNQAGAGYYGGASLCVHGNQLITGTANSKLQIFTIQGTTNNKSLSDNNLAVVTNIDNGAWTNGLAIDPASNLYVVSEYTGKLTTVALPYSGATTTPAPNQPEYTFTLAGDPIPNILATDLKYEAVPGKNQYKFSFNVNTKPSKAELRFYTSEADMLANNENVVFSYQFTDLHSGEMSVVFDAVHTTGTYEAGKTLSDTDGNGYLNLPRGEYYWNVYLEAPRNSQVFAPIYTQPTNGNRRLHATIDNNPDNDGFGHIYAVDGVDKKLMVYSIGEAQIDDNDKVNINTNNRYSSLQLLGVDLQNPRRPAVAPDGTVFLADAGKGQSVAVDGATGFEHAGIWVFDPSNKESEGTAQLTQFHQGSEAVSGISFYGTGDNLTLYKTNTYDEWTNHGDPEGYKDEKWQNNGYRVYDVGNPDGSVKHTLGDNVRYDGTGTLYPFGKGDARGNMSVKATSDAVWFCQHCKDKVSDTKIDGEYAVMLMCYNKQGERIFSSNIADITLEHNNQVSTSLSQDKNSIMQSAPGAGMTISPDEKYLYVVNHDGDILEFEIGGTANAKTLKHTNTFDTEYKAISSLHFDYAGNLVATAFYSTDENPNSHYDKTPYYSDIVVYTMPNEQENKRHIPAPKSFRFVPERISQDMGIYYMSWVVDEHKKDGVSIPVADVAVYRPLKSTYFNTFCLPFEVDLSTLADNHPYKVGDGGAVLLQFAGASINSVNGEEMLELQFSPTNVMEAGKPYLFKPKNDINTIISLGKQVTFDFVDYGSNDAIASHEVGWQFGDDENKATYLALLPNGLTIDDVENSSRIYLILVDNNRLAQVFTNGSVMGLRGIFYLDHALPAGTGARIVERKSIPTGVIDTQGRPINIEKYLREGRVYIRVGDSLYTITGEKVE